MVLVSRDNPSNVKQSKIRREPERPCGRATPLGTGRCDLGHLRSGQTTVTPKAQSGHVHKRKILLTYLHDPDTGIHPRPPTALRLAPT